MDNLVVLTKDLKPQYWFRNLMWKYAKRFYKVYANGWRRHAIVSFPLSIEIEMGNMQFYFLKHGFFKTLTVVKTYNKVICQRLDYSVGKVRTPHEIDTLNKDDFFKNMVLIDKEDIEIQLDNEIRRFTYIN